MTDYRKLDAALAAALAAAADAGDRLAGADDLADLAGLTGLSDPVLTVFVDLGTDESVPSRDRLAELGLPTTAGAGQVTSTTLSVRQVEALSEQPWVTRLTLSDALSPLGRSTAPPDLRSDRPEDRRGGSGGSG